MSDYQDQVDALVADYRRSREQLAEVQRELGAIRESAASVDRAVIATVGPHGNLIDLTFADDAFQRHSPAALAKQVVRATAEAAEQAARRAQQTLAPVLPADTDPAAVLAGRADLTEAEVAPPPEPEPAPAAPSRRPRRDHDDDDGYEHTSWLQSGSAGRTR